MSFLTFALALGAQATAPDLGAELARAVDLATPSARAEAARSLAKRHEVTLDSWLAATAAFGTFEKAEPGTRVVRVPLQVESEIEETELHVFVPRTYVETRPTPLILSFHGTGGTGASALPGWLDVAEQNGMLLLAPSEAGRNEGYAWDERERASVLAALRWMRRHYDVDENRVYATGFSRGGHLTWDLALRHPGIFAAIAPMCGSPRCSIGKAQNNTRYLENLVGTPIRDLQGAKDQDMLVFSVRLGFRRLDELHAANAKLVEFPDLEHDVNMDAVDWSEFFGRLVREPRPERVVQIAAHENAGRHAWVEIEELARGVDESFLPTIPAQKNGELTDFDKLELCDEQARAKSARLEATRLGIGRFGVTTDRVARLALWLTSADFEVSTPVEITIRGKTQKKKATPDPSVLLEDFVERFDRTFLPVARLELKP
jgi:predicted esterase